ncbi:MAG: hypothetical protein KIS94_01480 [Chitinophagales bacterium]|nr:hypothetical protein [Chitinophagales bacterium]
MAKSTLFHFVALLLALHCLGATQWISARAADKSSFVRMMAMTEEETKKEKDTNTTETETEYCGVQEKFTPPSNLPRYTISTYIALHERILPQFVSDLSTPPPDFV